MNRVSKIDVSASKIMEEKQGNCAQAIYATYGPYLSNGKVDFESCMLTASAFGGGINRTGNVCGAVTGALMALGLQYGEDVQEVTTVSAELLEAFKSTNDSIICRELVGYDLFDDENLRQAFEKDIFKNCVKYVDDVARLLEKHVALKEDITL